jgi:hypothetical protein
MYSLQPNTQECGTTEAAKPAFERSNTRSWKDFADLINASWRKGADTFFQTGRYLIEAKAELDRDQYGALIKLRLAFDQSVAKKLICVASNPLLGAHVHQLPPCWSTLYELTKLGDDVLKAALADGAIHPGMKRKEAVALRHPEGEGNGQGAAEATSTKTESLSTFEVLVRAWEAASQSDHRALFDHLGRAKLVAAMSDGLKSDFHDHIVKQMIATASKSSDFAVQSTARLHCMLRCAEQKEPSAEDIKYMLGAGRAMLRDAEKRNIPRSNILITSGEPQKRKPKK